MLASFRSFHQRSLPLPAVTVESSTVIEQNWQSTITSIGSLTASQGVVIKPETTGRVIAIYFRSGQPVQANAPLLQLNTALLQAKLAEASAQTKLSDANYQRARQLYQQKVLSKAELDKALALFRANQAQQAEAQASLNQTLVRAPFAGRLGLRQVEQGAIISPADTITHLEAMDPLRVDFTIPGVDSGKVSLGSKVFVHLSAFPGQTFTATIYAIDSEINASTRSLALRAVLPNPQQVLMPGSFVEVTLPVGAEQNLATIPETAINHDETGDYVYRIIHRHAIKTAVKMLFQKNDVVAVSGLQTGEQIISVGSFKVTNNSLVAVKP